MKTKGKTCPGNYPTQMQRYVYVGSVAERSKALVLGTSHFDGVGSNPTAAKYFCFIFLQNKWINQ